MHLRSASSAPRRPLLANRLVSTLCVLALLCPAAPSMVLAQNSLPALGDPEAENFTVGTERKLGDQIMREIRVDPDYLDDPVLLEYLDSIWQPLLKAARAAGNIPVDLDARFAWEAFLVRDPSVNAFALPGGYIGVHLGLIAMTATRDEFASVVAHELSHITQRHIARSIASSKRQSLLGMAAMVLGVLAASRTRSADAANAAIVGAQAATVQGQLNFSRDMEREADRVGLGVMGGAGFAPGGMAAMFAKLDNGSRLNDSGGFPYLRSHPLTTERIGEAQARLGTGPRVAPVSVLEHTVAQARARVLMDTRSDALVRLQALDTDRTATTPHEKLLSAYASALASTRLRDWARADASIAAALGLVRAAPTPSPRAERAVLLLQAESMLARGAAPQAARVLQPYATELSRPVLLLSAQIALAPSAPADPKLLEQRASDLQTWVAVHPLDSSAWGALGQVWARLQQPLRSLRADAESRYALGDLQGAVERLRAGQRLGRSGTAGGDFIDLSVIDARMRDIEVQRKQLSADDKGAR